MSVLLSVLLSWMLLAVAIYIAAGMLDGVKVKSFPAAMVVAAIFGVLNVAVGWLLFWLIVVGTAGIGYLLAFVTRLVVNTILLKVTDAVSDSIEIKNLGSAFVAAIIMSVVVTIGQWILPFGG